MFDEGKAGSDTQSILGDGSLGVGILFFLFEAGLHQSSFPGREFDLVVNFSRVQTPTGSKEP